MVERCVRFLFLLGRRDVQVHNNKIQRTYKNDLVETCSSLLVAAKSMTGTTERRLDAYEATAKCDAGKPTAL